MDQAQRRSAPPRTDEVISEERFQRYHAYARRHGVNWFLYAAGSPDPPAGVPALASLLTCRSRARTWRQGGVDRRLEPPQLPRPVRDRHHASVASPDAVRGQGRAVRAPLAGMDPVPGRRLPHPARTVGRDRDGDRAAGPRAGRHRLHLPRGDADPVGLAGDAEARRRPPGAGDGCRGCPGRRARQRAGAARLADSAPQGETARRQAGDISAHRASLAGARRHRHRPDLAERRAPVGVARWPAAAAQGGGHRGRELGHGDGRAAGARRARGPARDALAGEGSGDRRQAPELSISARGEAARDRRREAGR